MFQTVPRAASDYARATRREQKAALAAVRRQWRRMDREFDLSWSRVAPTLVAIIAQAQARTASLADEYVPDVLEETGQARAVAAAAAVNREAFVGVTGSGVSVADTLALAPVRAKQAVADGQTPFQALRSSGLWLTATVGTILSDTGRAVETTAMAVRPVGGYVRMLQPPSCGRCAVLAGRWYRRNEGFQRHPQCDCRHIPTSEGIGGDMTLDLDAYLRSLDDDQLRKVLGSDANVTAWRDYGADPTQIINAYRGGMRTAQDLRGNRVTYTTDASTRRSVATYRMRNASRLDFDAGAVMVDGRARLVRRMPETILRTSRTREAALHQLRLYGWIA